MSQDQGISHNDVQLEPMEDDEDEEGDELEPQQQLHDQQAPPAPSETDLLWHNITQRNIRERLMLTLANAAEAGTQANPLITELLDRLGGGQGQGEPGQGHRRNSSDPSTHTYLGTNLRDVARSCPLLEGSVVELPILLLRGVVLFPGETLPLRLYNVEYGRLIRDMLREAGGLTETATTTVGRAVKHLGVLNVPRESYNPQTSLVGCVGTTTEICAAIQGPDIELWEVAATGGIVLKAKGRHRFRILPNSSSPIGYYRRQGVLWAQVEILEEDRVPPLKSILPVPRPFRQAAMESNRFQATHCPVHPTMRLFSPHHLVRRAQEILTSVSTWAGVTELNIGQPGAGAFGSTPGSVDLRMAGNGTDPNLFSFRLGANLPLDDAARQELLNVQSVVHRLQKEIRILQDSSSRALCCVQCASRIASKSAIFGLPGAEGAVGAYVNPDGFVHQTITLREIRHDNALQLDGNEVAEHSWFPGYAWTIAYCGRCGVHMGWRFRRVIAAPNTPVEQFWGIRRTALADERPRADGDVTDESEDEEEEDDYSEYTASSEDEQEEDGQPGAEVEEEKDGRSV